MSKFFKAAVLNLIILTLPINETLAEAQTADVPTPPGAALQLPLVRTVDGAGPTLGTTVKFISIKMRETGHCKYDPADKTRVTRVDFSRNGDIHIQTERIGQTADVFWDYVFNVRDLNEMDALGGEHITLICKPGHFCIKQRYEKSRGRADDPVRVSKENSITLCNKYAPRLVTAFERLQKLLGGARSSASPF